MATELLLSVLTAVLTLLAALITQMFTMRTRREKELARKKVETIARSFERVGSVENEIMLDITTDRISAGLTPPHFEELLKAPPLRTPAPPPEQHDAVGKLILGYHEQALGQAKAQFWFSVVAATVGFAWILYSGSTISTEDLATTSRILPGVVLDAVAFLFFRQAAETRQRATELYDRLRRDKLVTESVALVSSIEDARVRSAVKAQIALHMSGIQPAPIDLTNFLSSERTGERSVGGNDASNIAT